VHRRRRRGWATGATNDVLCGHVATTTCDDDEQRKKHDTSSAAADTQAARRTRQTDRPTDSHTQAGSRLPASQQKPAQTLTDSGHQMPATAPARASYRPVIYCLMAPSRRSGRPPGEKSKNGSCSNKRVLRAQGRRLPPSDGATDSTDRRRVWSMALNETTREPADPAPTTRLWGSGRLLAHAAAIWRTETK